jgi:hypothetical protein
LPNEAKKEAHALKKPSRQLTSATALVQLLTDYPELLALDWSIFTGGGLTGSRFGVEDLSDAAASITDALGGRSYESLFTSVKDSLPHPVMHIDTVWRDVAVSVTLGGAAPAVASTPVGLPSAWTAAAVAS